MNIYNGYSEVYLDSLVKTDAIYNSNVHTSPIKD